MKDYLPRIEKIKKQLTVLQGENFTISPSGTNYIFNLNLDIK